MGLGGWVGWGWGGWDGGCGEWEGDGGVRQHVKMLAMSNITLSVCMIVTLTTIHPNPDFNPNPDHNLILTLILTLNPI